MKKITLFLLVCFFMAVGNAFAYQQLLSQGVHDDSFTRTTDSGGDYVVNDYTNYSMADAWSTEFLGYSSTTTPTISYSGYYLGTFQGNDDPTVTADLIDHYLTGTPYSIGDWVKIDSDDGDDTGTTPKLTYTVTDAAPDHQEGTWSLDPSTFTLSFYAVKGGNGGFALYYLDPTENNSSGFWSTEHLWNVNSQDHAVQASISHFSASIVSTPVPEPATMIIFGVCFATLAGFRLRKKK